MSDQCPACEVPLTAETVFPHLKECKVLNYHLTDLRRIPKSEPVGPTDPEPVAVLELPWPPNLGHIADALAALERLDEKPNLIVYSYEVRDSGSMNGALTTIHRTSLDDGGVTLLWGCTVKYWPLRSRKEILVSSVNGKWVRVVPSQG